jgi:nucleoside-diphosphate-sugar epimerase
MRILITGAAGGIGSTLAHKLVEEGNDLILVDNLRNGYIENLTLNSKKIADLKTIDIRNIESVKQKNIDAVIHLAAITSLVDAEANPEETLSINVGGTLSVLNFCRKNDINNIIFSSTSAVYENNKEKIFTEDLSVNPKLMYSLSKKMSEDLCESFRINYGMNITTLRFFNVFGPKQDRYRKNPPLLNYIIKQYKSNLPIILHSDGTQTRDYIHIDDVINLTNLCLKKNPNSLFNVCTNTLTSVNEIIKYVSEEIGIELKPIYREAEKLWDSYPQLFEGKYCLDKKIVAKETSKYSLGSYEKVKKQLNWVPNINIKNLIKNTTREILKI